MVLFDRYLWLLLIHWHHYPEYFIRNMLSAAKSLIMIGIQMDFDNILKWQIAIINRCAFHPVQARK
jgi:hypothetical protein